MATILQRVAATRSTSTNGGASTIRTAAIQRAVQTVSASAPAAPARAAVPTRSPITMPSPVAPLVVPPKPPMTSEPIYMPTGKGPTTPTTLPSVLPAWARETPGFNPSWPMPIPTEAIPFTDPRHPNYRQPVSPAPAAQSTTQAILAASSGGPIMPSIVPPSPDLPSIPSPEEAIMIAAEEGSAVDDVTAGPPSGGGGGALLAGAGAGFLIAGPVGAIIGGFLAGAMSRRKPTPPVSGFGAAPNPVAAMLFGRLAQQKQAAGEQVDPAFIQAGLDAEARLLIAGSSGQGHVTSVVTNPDGTRTFTFESGFSGTSKKTGGVHGALIKAKPYIETAGKAGIVGTALLMGGAGAAAIAGGFVRSGGGAAQANAMQPVAETPAEAAIMATAGQSAPAVTAVDSSGAPLTSAKGGAAGPLAGGVAGFMVAGPVGAIAGVAIGYALSKR